MHPTSASRPSAPPVALSVSQLRLLATCERRWWWSAVGSRPGWEPTADETTRLAWACKCLTTLPALLGVGVHEAAARIAAAHRDGRRPPPFDELLAAVRRLLNEAWRASQAGRAQHVAAPRRHGCFEEHFYGTPIYDADIARLRVRLHSALRRLYTSPVWEDVRECGRGDVLRTDSLDWVGVGVELEGAPPIRLYAAPDLLYLNRGDLEVDGVRVPHGVPVLVDWKTGKSDAAVGLQMRLYALYAAERLRLRAGQYGYVARVIDLAGPNSGIAAERRFLIGPRELDGARDALYQAALRIVAMRDATGVIPRDVTPRASDAAACRRCAFRAVCQ